MENKYIAKKGNVWFSLKLQLYLSNILILSKDDTIENYEERPAPKEVSDE